MADDEALVRELVVAALEDSECQVLTAMNGREAFSMAASQKPDLILLDLKMPATDGMDALRQLKSEPATAKIPVIVLTGGATRANVRRALTLGATDFISKSGFHLDTLKEKIAKALQQAEPTTPAT
ncbi:MAG TPA: response regulator [Acidobacteriota bacterium]|nr:response regulator [Acidobacteriota bacterium]